MTEGAKNNFLKYGGKAVEWSGIALAVWFWLLPTLDDHTEQKIKDYHKADTSKKSFRVLVGEELDWKPDRVHINLSKAVKTIKKIKKDLYNLKPHIDQEREAITPRLIILSGREYWVASDGENYRVHREENGEGYYFKSGEWLPIFY